MLLHTLNRPPGHPVSHACLERLAAEDTLLLLGDGVYHALAGGAGAADLAALPCPVGVLRADALAAGVLARLAPGVELVDDPGFVELTERYPSQLAWY